MVTKDWIDNFRRFNRFYANLLSRFDREMYGDYFSLVESNVVTELAEAQPLTANELSTRLHIDKSQLSKIIAKLTARQLLNKQLNPNDKRVMHLTLTKQGKALHERQIDHVRKAVTNEVARFTPQELMLLSQQMRQYQHTYEKNRQVEIGVGTAADVGFIADLHSRIYTDKGYRPIFQTYVLDALADFIRTGMHGQVWVAKVDGKRVGTISLVQTNDNHWQVRWFVLDPLYQGLGIGKQLVQQLMTFVQENHIENIYLWTVSDLSAARHLYRQAGFQRVEVKTNTEWTTKTLTEEKWIWQNKNVTQ